jgi:hypothetical protein
MRSVSDINAQRQRTDLAFGAKTSVIRRSLDSRANSTGRYGPSECQGVRICSDWGLQTSDPHPMHAIFTWVFLRLVSNPAPTGPGHDLACTTAFGRSRCRLQQLVRQRFTRILSAGAYLHFTPILIAPTSWVDWLFGPRLVIAGCPVKLWRIAAPIWTGRLSVARTRSCYFLALTLKPSPRQSRHCSWIVWPSSLRLASVPRPLH